MWFEKLLAVIDSSWIGSAVERRLELIGKTDPEHIYVENIRSFFNLPYRTAHFFCDLAVREGVFTKRWGYLCPKDMNVVTYLSEDQALPETVVCRACEAEGEEEFEFDPKRLKTIEVYSVAS